MWGAQFGSNTYWAAVFRIPGVYPKIWVPSLYLGGMTFVLACSDVRISKGPAVAGVAFGDRHCERSRWAGQVHQPDLDDACVCRVAGRRPRVRTRRRSTSSVPTRSARTDSCAMAMAASTGCSPRSCPASGSFVFPQSSSHSPRSAWRPSPDSAGTASARRTRGAVTLSAILLGITVCVFWESLGPAASRSGDARQIKVSSMFGPFDSEARSGRSSAPGARRVVLASGSADLLPEPRSPDALGCSHAVAGTVRPGRRQLAVRLHRSPGTVRDQAGSSRAHRSRGTRTHQPGPFRVHRMPLWNPPGWHKTASTDRVSDFVPGSAAPCSRSTESTWVSSTPIRSASPSSMTTNGSSTASPARSMMPGTADVSASRGRDRRLSSLAAASTSGTRVISSCPSSPTAGTTRCGPRPHFCSSRQSTRSRIVHRQGSQKRNSGNGSIPRTIESTETNKSSPRLGRP